MTTGYSNHDPEKWAKGKEPALVVAMAPSVLLPFRAQADTSPARGGGRVGPASHHQRKKNASCPNNIYGVDIDAQAVEVTKLSLLLKVLEDESGQLTLGFERALPDLGENIKCGNSLIGPDYYEGRQLGLGLFDEEEQYRVNAFDWKK